MCHIMCCISWTFFKIFTFTVVTLLTFPPPIIVSWKTNSFSKGCLLLDVTSKETLPLVESYSVQGSMTCPPKESFFTQILCKVSTKRRVLYGDGVRAKKQSRLYSVSDYVKAKAKELLVCFVFNGGPLGCRNIKVKTSEKMRPRACLYIWKWPLGNIQTIWEILFQFQPHRRIFFKTCRIKIDIFVCLIFLSFQSPLFRSIPPNALDTVTIRAGEEETPSLPHLLLHFLQPPTSYPPLHRCNQILNLI